MSDNPKPANRQAVDPKFSGEAQPIRSFHKMGERAFHEKAPTSKLEGHLPPEANSQAQNSNVFSEENKLVLGSAYYPLTKESKAAYDQILDVIYKRLPDFDHSLIIELANEVLAIFKQPGVPEPDRRSQLSALITLNDDQFAKLKSLATEIKDFVSKPKTENQKAHDDIINIEIDKGENDVEMKFNRSSLQQEDATYFGSALEEEEETEQPLASGIKEENTENFDHNFLFKLISKEVPNEFEAREIEQKILEVLDTQNEIELQNRLMEFADKLDILTIKKIYDDRTKIFYGYLLSINRKNPEKLNSLLNQIRTNESLYSELSLIVRDFEGPVEGEALSSQRELADISALVASFKRGNDLTLEAMARLPKRVIPFKPQNKELISFGQSSLKLPKGSTRITEQGYEEVLIPASPPLKIDPAGLLTPEQLPSWARPVFADLKKFNAIQSTVFPFIFSQNGNALVCAPTGAGKTVIAIFAILKLVSENLDSETGLIDLSSFKAVYLAPMKALVAELVSTLNFRFESLGLKAAEFTGDVHLTSAEFEQASIIVSTPEKWDVLSRKSAERHFTDKMRLLIIDEVHLLGDSRGPVLEAVGLRTLALKRPRVLALSATLPNFDDVARFLEVERDKGLFYFSNAHRPVPLSQALVGVSESRGVKRMLLMKEILFKKVIERIKEHQVLVFVHSRKETSRTAEELKEMALGADLLDLFAPEQSRQVLEGLASEVANPDLRNVLASGIGLHHAGLSRGDRRLVEDLFSSGRLSVLISTATLAWGVNLPAHTVIIKNTQVYSSALGKWTPLGLQDILQMLGRAGRPLYDKEGEGLILTSAPELKHYLSLLNEQLPIESQMLGSVSELLNAEIVNGNVQDLKEGFNWLRASFFGIRLAKEPKKYGVEGADKVNAFLLDVLHTAAVELETAGLIHYDRGRGVFESLPEGRIASYYYIKPENMRAYLPSISAESGLIDFFRIFTSSSEFRNIIVREEERLELAKLHAQVPIPIPGPSDSPAAKVSVLLQCFISRVELEGYALHSDLKFVSQNAQRIFRALFELCILKGVASATTALEICKMVERRLWSSLSPLRQFASISEKILRRIEQQEQLTWEHFRSLSVGQLNTVLKSDQAADLISCLLRNFPQIEVGVQARTLSRAVISVDLTISANFDWNFDLHGRVLDFHVFVSDVDGEALLHHQPFVLTKEDFAKRTKRTKSLNFTVALTEQLQPFYFIKITSDDWIGAETQLPLSFKNLALPEKFPLSRQVEDTESLNSANCEFLARHGKAMGLDSFSQAQSQIFEALYNGFDNILISAAGNFGKFTLAMAAVARLFEESQHSKALLIFPNEQVLVKKLKLIAPLIEALKLSFGILSSNLQKDLLILTKSQLIFSTYKNFDRVSRNYKKRPQLKQVRLIIASGLHELADGCSEAEVVLSRLRLIFSLLEQRHRLVALSFPVADFASLCEWLGVEPANAFSFSPSVLNNEISASVHGLDAVEEGQFAQSAVRRLVSIAKLSRGGLSGLLLFVENLELAREVLSSSIKFLFEAQRPLLKDADEREILAQAAKGILDGYNAGFVAAGAACVYKDCDADELEALLQLFRIGALKVLVVEKKAVELVRELSPQIVGLVENESFSSSELQAIFSLANEFEKGDKTPKFPEIKSEHRKSPVRRFFVICQDWRKRDLKRRLFEPLIAESALTLELVEYLNSEIVAGTVESPQDCLDWLTWTFFYRRLAANPNYYGLASSDAGTLSDFLSELVEAALGDLKASGCLEAGESALSGTPLGVIASFYNIRVSSVHLLNQKAGDSLTLGALIEALASASEFEKFAASSREVSLIREMHELVPLKLQEADFDSFEAKIGILLQAYLIRINLAGAFSEQIKDILRETLNLIQAFIDCCSASYSLKPALIAMRLSQMIAQRVWRGDSSLKQLPFFDEERLTKSQQFGIAELEDFFEIGDDLRGKIFEGLSERQVMEIARFSNRFPNVSAKASLSDEKRSFLAGEALAVNIELQRENWDESQENAPLVLTCGVLRDLEENWWILVCDKERKQLFAVKKVAFGQAYSKPLAFDIVLEGKFDLSVIFVCDAYMGFDIELPITTVEITAGALEEEQNENEQIEIEK